MTPKYSHFRAAHPLRHLLSGVCMNHSIVTVVGLITILFSMCTAWAESSYFPGNAFPCCSADKAECPSDWYASFLREMKEPPLYGRAMPDNAAVYRLLWFPREGNVRLFRAERQAESCQLKYIVLGGNPVDRSSKTEYEKTLPLSLAEWEKLATEIKRMDFWNAPTRPSRNEAIFDGAFWLLEGADGGRYHVVKRNILNVREGRDEHLYAFFRIVWSKVLEH